MIRIINKLKSKDQLSDDRYQRAVIILDKFGLIPLENLKSLSQTFSKQAINALNGRESSLLMITTRLTLPNKEQLRKGERALVIEIGGTNIRAAIVEVGIRKNVTIAKDQNKQLLYKEKPLRNLQFANAKEFFSQITTEIIDKVLKEKLSIHAIGIIYSFPGKAFQDGKNVDIRSSEQLTKELHIPGISKESIGNALLKIIIEKHSEISKDLRMCVMNDAPAVLFSTDNARIGGVVASGENFALVYQNEVFNGETGNFNAIPSTAISKKIDEQSDNREKGLAEKQTSGIYIEKSLQLVAERLYELELLSKLPENLLATRLNEIIKPYTLHLLRKKEQDKKIIVDQMIMAESAWRLLDRSAQIVAITIAGSLESFSSLSESVTSNITIPIEGSFFWKVEGYRQRVTNYLHQLISNKTIHFKYAQHAGILGAARIALAA